MAKKGDLVWSCSRWADSDRLIAVLDGRQYATILQQEVGTEGVQSGHARVGKDCLCDGGNGLRRLACNICCTELVPEAPGCGFCFVPTISASQSTSRSYTYTPYHDRDGHN